MQHTRLRDETARKVGRGSRGGGDGGTAMEVSSAAPRPQRLGTIVSHSLHNLHDVLVIQHVLLAHLQNRRRGREAGRAW